MMDKIFGALEQLITKSWSDSLTVSLNRSVEHDGQKSGRPSIMTGSLLIKDIIKFDVWEVEEIVKFSKLPCCYVFRDTNGEILYVGQSKTFWERFSQHNYSLRTNTSKVKLEDSMGKKRIFGLYLRFRTVEVYQLDIADVHNRLFLEQCLISLLKPAHNLYTQGIITADDYIEILSNSPKMSQWSSCEKDQLINAKNNWPKTEYLREQGIID